MSEFGETKISDLPIGDRLKTSLLRELSSMKYLSNPRDTVAALKEYIGFDEDEDRIYAFQSLGRIRGIGKKSVDLVWYPEIFVRRSCKSCTANCEEYRS
jgi:hypothetical protein